MRQRAIWIQQNATENAVDALFGQSERAVPQRYGVGTGEGVTVLVVCGAVPVGEGLAVGDGATVFVVCGCVPEGDALASGVTVAVATGEDWSGVTVAVGRGPAGTLGLTRAVGLGSASVCATTWVTVNGKTVPTIASAISHPRALLLFIRIHIMTANLRASLLFHHGKAEPIRLALRTAC